MTDDEIIGTLKGHNARYKNTEYEVTGRHNIAGTTAYAVTFLGEDKKTRYTQFLIEFTSGQSIVCPSLFELFTVLQSRPPRLIDNTEAVRTLVLAIVAILITLVVAVLASIRVMAGDGNALTALLALATGVIGYVAGKKA